MSGFGVDSAACELTYFRGRVALCAILKALGVHHGAEVAVQAFTCVAVPEAVMAAGARPLYIDTEAPGFNMDACDLGRKLTPNTRAIVVQHTYGIPADMDRILSVARRADVPIVEDCCHTLASSYKGKAIGGFGVASFYSYEWGKPIVAGIGGSAVVNVPELLARMRQSYASYCYPPAVSELRIELQYYAFKVLYRPFLYWPVRAAFHWLGSLGVAESNYNPVGEGAAADFGLRMASRPRRRLARKLALLGEQTLHSRWVAHEYNSRIRSPSLSHPLSSQAIDVVFARYPLLTAAKPALLAAARRAGVELSEWYSTPVHPLCGPQLRLLHYEPGSCPAAEALCTQIVTLPTHPSVTKRDVDRTVRFLNEVDLS